MMWYMYTRLLEPDQISYTQSMVAKRGLTYWHKFSYRCGKSRLKHTKYSTADFQSIQQFDTIFIAKKK